jgi:hypothetical protein
LGLECVAISAVTGEGLLPLQRRLLPLVRHDSAARLPESA